MKKLIGLLLCLLGCPALAQYELQWQLNECSPSYCQSVDLNWEYVIVTTPYSWIVSTYPNPYIYVYTDGPNEMELDLGWANTIYLHLTSAYTGTIDYAATGAYKWTGAYSPEWENAGGNCGWQMTNPSNGWGVVWHGYYVNTCGYVSGNIQNYNINWGDAGTIAETGGTGTCGTPVGSAVTKQAIAFSFGDGANCITPGTAAQWQANWLNQNLSPNWNQAETPGWEVQGASFCVVGAFSATCPTATAAVITQSGANVVVAVDGLTFLATPTSWSAANVIDAGSIPFGPNLCLPPGNCHTCTGVFTPDESGYSLTRVFDAGTFGQPLGTYTISGETISGKWNGDGGGGSGCAVLSQASPTSAHITINAP